MLNVTVPIVLLPVLVRTGAMVFVNVPELLSEKAPLVSDTCQLQILGVEVKFTRLIFIPGLRPLQIAVLPPVITGRGFTETVINAGLPKQPNNDLGVTL